MLSSGHVPLGPGGHVARLVERLRAHGATHGQAYRARKRGQRDDVVAYRIDRALEVGGDVPRP